MKKRLTISFLDLQTALFEVLDAKGASKAAYPAAAELTAEVTLLPWSEN